MGFRTHNLLFVGLACSGAGFISCTGQAPHTSPSTEGATQDASSMGPGTTPSETDASVSQTGEAAAPFLADPPSVYVAKVKNILIGLPPTDQEVQAIAADPTQIGALIAGWQQQPEYATKMLRFFELAFQQTQISSVDFADEVYPNQIAINGTTTPLLVQNAQESFARTMNALTAQNQPMTQGVTTTQLMMTTALKEFYAFLDTWEVDDNSKVTDYFHQANPKLSITVEAAQGAIPMAQTLDPTSPNYMVWYDPDVATPGATIPAGCGTDPIVYASNGMALHYLLYGSLLGHKAADGTACPPTGGTAKAPQLQTTDFADWTMVDVRQPKTGEATTAFYNLPALRSATELVLNIPRVGFFSTPAFAANWQTNTSNEMRATINQTLIVATGSSIDGTDTTTPPTTPGLDTTHADQAACFTCHRLLDPTRSILASLWSWNYHGQLDPAFSGQPGLFAFRGVIQPVSSLQDLANVLATHPYFAPGWVQKFCYYANSSPCDPTDPAFLQMTSDFQKGGYNWNAMVKELLSSPIVTHAAVSQTEQTYGEIVSTERRDHLCAALNARLGFADVCGLNVLTKAAALQTISEIVSGLPSDAYGRGAPAPILPTQPTLFFRAGTENICEAVAAQVIDVPTAKQIPGVKQWSSANPAAAISDFVSIVMGLPPSDPRASQAQTLLTSHFQAASQQTSITTTAALQSTFVAACLSPSAVSMGM